MKLVILFLALDTLLAVANSVCTNNYNNKECIKKVDAPEWMKGYYLDGDPCFERNGGRWCFYAEGQLGSGCDCSNPDCGCGSTPPEPVDPYKGYKLPKKKCSLCKKYKKFNEKGNRHTLCKKKYCKVDKKKCGKVAFRGIKDFEEADRQAIVDAHNALRAKVARGEETQGVGGVGQPGASDMMELVWDKKLADVAQGWTDQCKGGHDKNRRTPDFQWWVGQNYAWSAASYYREANLLAGMVQMWYNEVKGMPAANVDAFSSAGAIGVIGHYTQVVWAKTAKVGCGFIKYKAKGSNWHSQTLVCNYGPGGNIARAPIYNTTGSPGDNCDNGGLGIISSGDNNGLCKNPDA